jgi:transglutaminase-like putative cysteine protease
MPILTAQSANLDDYLAQDELIDHGHPAIRQLAEQLDPEAVFEYVRDRIAHSYDVDRWSAAYRASDVLAAGNSICHGQAHLLAALLRAKGIPAGLCYQRITVMHGLVAAHWPAGWVRLDPRNPSTGFATRPQDEKLAYPDVPCTGTVYATVPPELALCLSRARPDVAGFDYLEAELAL